MGFLDDFFGGVAGNGGDSSAAQAGTYFGDQSPLAMGIRAARGKQTFQDPNGYAGQASQKLGFDPQQSGPFGTGSYRQNDPTGAANSMRQAGGPDMGQQGMSRDEQAKVLAQLQAQASGQGPSLAQMQLQQATDRNAANAMGLMASQRGMNPGMAARLAGQQTANINQQAAGQSAMARLAEQYQAQQAAAGLAGQMRQGDLDVAQMQQQNNQFNAGGYNQLLGQGYGTQGQQQTAQNQQIANMEQQRQQGNIGLRNGIIQGLFGAGSGVAGGAAQGALTPLLGSLLSDARAKENVRSDPKSIRAMLAALDAKAFNYKDPKAPGAAEGDRWGILVQDLEKTPAGKALVIATPKGKGVDTPQAVGTLLAAAADTHGRLSESDKKRAELEARVAELEKMLPALPGAKRRGK